MKRRHSSGLSAIEVILSTAIGAVVLGGGIAVTLSSGEVARSSAAEDQASRHVEKVLRTTADEIRRSSRGTVALEDGTQLTSGTATGAFRSRRVLGYSGGALLGATSTMRFVLAPGAATGEVVRSQSGVEETIARGITSFSVARNADAFTISVTARSGPADDRGRGAHGSVTVVARNP